MTVEPNDQAHTKSDATMSDATMSDAQATMPAASSTQALASVLLVDDLPTNLRLLMGILAPQGYKLRPVTSGTQALIVAQTYIPDLILLDISMPEMDGIEVCKRLKADERTCDVPVIFISALGEADDKVRAFEAGGIDYILKPFQEEEVILRVHNHLRLRQLQQQLERQVAELTRLHQQVSEQARQLEELSFRDGLTGVYNRRYLDKRLSEEFARAKRYAQPLSVLMCDIDAFKHINDTFSHAIGDDVLRILADILRRNTREVDFVARYGGEEFVVAFPATGIPHVLQAAEKIRLLVEAYPWQQLHPELHVTLSLGVSDDMSTANYEQLLKLADDKLYEAKRSGKNKVCS